MVIVLKKDSKNREEMKRIRKAMKFCKKNYIDNRMAEYSLEWESEDKRYRMTFEIL